jgi:hypothetical protein
MESIKGNSTSIEAVKDKIYVRDICVRCGETVERSKGESQCATS